MIMIRIIFLIAMTLTSGCVAGGTKQIRLTNGSPQFIMELERRGWNVIDQTPWYDKGEKDVRY